MIRVVKEPDPEPPFEECCFCFTQTRFWTFLVDRTPGQQVACCEPCAKTHEPSDVPSKHDWCEAARKRHPRFYAPWGS